MEQLRSFFWKKKANRAAHPIRQQSRISNKNNHEKSQRDDTISENAEKVVKPKINYCRSRSLQVLNYGQEKNISHSSSTIRNPWRCQLCQAPNHHDCESCSNCGSSKVNIFMPVLSHSSDTISGKHVNREEASNFEKFFSVFSSDYSIYATDKLLFSQPVILRLQHPKDHNHNSSQNQPENIYRRSVLITDKREADENIVFMQIEKILNTLTSSHSRFEDDTFAASSQSLYFNGISLSPSTLAFLPKEQTNVPVNSWIQWLRPDEIIPADWNHNRKYLWTVFRSPKPNDVLQGALGDCWFITALSVLAEEPEYLMKVLITKEYNYQGFYYVRLCKDGEWTQVIVDDRLPCTPNKRLAYSQARRKQLWVPIIEKAFAKLNGTYESLIAGRCCEGLSTVTGSPCETLILGCVNNPNDKSVDHNMLWEKLLHARSQKFLMCAMCSNNLISKQEFDNNGLLNIHAYSLQDVKQSYDGKFRLVKLRNPWGGAHRWIGDWSDDSPLWNAHPDLRHQLLPEKRSKKDGVFWMPFESFVRYFECVDICKIRPEWYEARDSGNFVQENGFMQAYYLTVHNITELDITLHRKINKNLRVQKTEQSLFIAIVKTAERSNGHHRIYSIPILSQQGQHKFISTDGILQPGIYLILPFLLNPVDKQVDNTEFNIAVHSSCAIDLERIKFPSRIRRELLIKLSLIYGEQVRLHDKDESNDQITIYELKSYWDGLILMVENKSPTKNIHFHFRCTLSQNASMSRKDSHHQVFDVIPPMHRQIIVTISRKNPSHSFTIGHDYNYVFSTQNYIKNSYVNKQKHWPNIDESTVSEDIHLPQNITSAKVD